MLLGRKIRVRRARAKIKGGRAWGSDWGSRPWETASTTSTSTLTLARLASLLLLLHRQLPLRHRNRHAPSPRLLRPRVAPLTPPARSPTPGAPAPAPAPALGALSPRPQGRTPGASLPWCTTSRRGPRSATTPFTWGSTSTRTRTSSSMAYRRISGAFLSRRCFLSAISFP